MNILQGINKQIFDYFKDKYSLVISPEQLFFDTCKDKDKGDFSTNICFRISKNCNSTPISISEDLSKYLNTQNSDISTNSLNGFLNIKLSPILLSEYFQKLNFVDFQFVSKESQILVEFGQPNTHKAFHVGHLKSAISGLAVANLLENIGYDVKKINYFGDIGLHVAKCIYGFLVKQSDKLPALTDIKLDDIFVENISKQDVHTIAKFLDTCYTLGAKSYDEEQSKNYIVDINKALYNKSNIVLNQIYDLTRKWSISHQDDAFLNLGVRYDRQYPETEIVKSALEILDKNIDKFKIDIDNSVIYDSDMADDKKIKTFVYKTQLGLPTYSTKDLGLAYAKLKDFPKFNQNITFTSVEQSDYFRNVYSALTKIDPKLGHKMKHVAFGWLLRNNKKASSRMGDSIKGMDIIHEVIESVKTVLNSKDREYVLTDREIELVGVSSLKFLILSHEFHTDINYDPDEFTKLSGFSGPYVMYSYVRAKSIIKNVIDLEFQIAKDYIPNTEELDLIKHILEYKKVSQYAAEKLEPHRVCHYMYDLAVLFNKFYDLHKVLVEDRETKQFRVNLVQKVAYILKLSMNILGIEEVERM